MKIYDNKDMKGGFIFIDSPSNNKSIKIIIAKKKKIKMQSSGMLSVFHFLFCQLVEECYTLYKEDHYLDNLKRIGKQTGYKIFNQICLKRGIYQRPQTLTVLMKTLQQKVFKHLFGYQANSFYTAVKEDEQEKQYFYVLVDDVSIYMSWMPQNLWETSIFFAGMIEAMVNCSGIQCEVSCSTKNEKGDKIETEYFIKLSEKEHQKWKQE